MIGSHGGWHTVCPSPADGSSAREAVLRPAVLPPVDGDAHLRVLIRVDFARFLVCFRWRASGPEPGGTEHRFSEVPATEHGFCERMSRRFLRLGRWANETFAPLSCEALEPTLIVAGLTFSFFDSTNESSSH